MKLLREPAQVSLPRVPAQEEVLRAAHMHVGRQSSSAILPVALSDPLPVSEMRSFRVPNYDRGQRRAVSCSLWGTCRCADAALVDETCTQVPVETWRTRLWEEALVEAADLRDWPLAERLQRCFTETRLAHFKLEPGVKVRFERSIKSDG